MRLVDADAYAYPGDLVYEPTIDAVPVARCNELKKELLQKMQEFRDEWRSISESTIDYFGGKAEAMEIAMRLVSVVLTDFCSHGERPADREDLSSAGNK